MQSKGFKLINTFALRNLYLITMHIGLFFGSFNPIHTGHLVIANYMANYTRLDKVWLVVSPHNPLKNKEELINIYDRIEMIRLAIEDNLKLDVCDIELKLPQPSYTIATLIYLKEKYPDYIFSLIMGEDNLSSLTKWKNYELILRDYKIYVYPRPGTKESDLKSHPNVEITKTPLMELSAGFIRSAIRKGKSVEYMLPSTVLKFIEAKGLFK